MKPRTVWMFAILAALLFILAALICEVRGNYEPPVPATGIEPSAPPHAASGLLIAAVPPEVQRDGLNTYPMWDEVLEEAKAAIPDELAERAARLVYGEYRGSDYAQQTAPLWCVCNRADAWGWTIDEVMDADHFHGLGYAGAVSEYYVDLAREVFARWALEKEGYLDVGRTLGAEYLYFHGDGAVNIYRTEYTGGVYCTPTGN